MRLCPESSYIFQHAWHTLNLTWATHALTSTRAHTWLPRSNLTYLQDDGNPLEYVEVGKKKNPFLAVRLYSTPRNPADIIIKVVTPFGRIQAKPDQNGVQFSSATTCQHGNTEGRCMCVCVFGTGR